MRSSTGSARGLRARLFLTSALVACVTTAPAFAQSTRGDVTRTEAEAFSTGRDALTPTQPEAYSNQRIVGAPTPEPQIVISNPGTSVTSRDAANITGIAQMIVDQQNGFLGLCTGSLINPRTVLFAAHCVNTRAATAYGAASGGTPIGFGFENFLRSNGPGQVDELGQWFFAGPNQYRTNVAGSFFNVSQVRYNPVSLEPEARGFLYADIATATLDTPAAGIPTWALLFSQLPATTITANGTGYNVQIVGYGSHGNAATGSASGSDFRRRTAENMIGALTDLRQFETFLFGASTSPTQNLYFIDFDDPRRGLTGASPFDFNAFRDNARGANLALPTEGTTAPGDSGSPLIVQNFARPLVAGVLSGGYARFFNNQPLQNSYGTVSFYQPLFLYWDWIAANNPYRYASAVAGDGLWTDPTRWVTTNDPNYFIIGPNGAVVNGVPNDLGLGKNGTNGDFGEICFQTTTSSECRNTATGQERFEPGKPIGTDGGQPELVNAISDNKGTGVLTEVSRGDLMTDARPEAYADGAQVGQALPPATIVNGLPGATNFVPNNVDPVRLTGAIGRYFDVALTQSGTTTLNTAVTIDRFTLAAAAGRLNIATTGTLNVLMDTTQVSGVTTVDGTLNSRGDFLLLGGGLTGSGRVNAPFTTSVTAAIAPGTQGTVGTLTFGGNLVLASGSSLVIDLGPNLTSDRVAVVTTTAAGVTPANGAANIGGRVAFGAVAGTTVRNGDLYTILTAQGGVTGTFFAPSSLSAILTPQFVYSANQVQARIIAGNYIGVVAGNSPVQVAYARLLDQNRAVGAFPGIYDVLDLQNATTIQSTLEALAPRTETLKSSLAIAAVDNTSRLIRERLSNLTPSGMNGSLAYIGRPIQTAALATMPGLAAATATDAQGDASTITEGALPDTMSGFLAGGYLDGNSAPMATALPFAGRDRFDGFYVAGGIEAALGDASAIGFALSYTDLKGQTPIAGQSAEGELYQGTLYGKTGVAGFELDAQVSAGLLSAKTTRAVSIVTNNFTLQGKDDALTFSSEVGVGKFFGESIQFGPRLAVRASHIGFSRIAETGGGPALAIDRESFSSVQGRAGLVLKGGTTFRPYASGTYVREFLDRPVAFGANFVGGVGPNAIFALNGEDKDWFEVSGGLAVDTGNITLSVSADTTLDRDDVENQSYRASIKVRF